ncbi:CRISPR-associated helicase Cas3' [Synechococcus bigranulatus str. 'Rupite']|uniref:CRISPR-associated helicase Cas3 n=2 Tax=Thermostichus vulcanus TaxID=32053 RepID=A0ABT0CBE8_THEVL|nr:CRISPR-associated helicase Cas3' [Thermostichus vulcanus]MCJ2543095.1 CRISPR-associated helicase Cas3' [Thermostichus vulcanus str. 'Rupite']
MTSGIPAHAHTPNPSGTWHVLKDHLYSVARATQFFSMRIGTEQLGFYAGLWHDLGKYNPEFQSYLEQCHRASTQGAPPPRRSQPHAIYGAVLAAHICPPIASLIYGHHSGIPSLADLRNKLAEKRQDASWQTVYQSVLQRAKQDGIPLEPSPEYRQEIERLGRDPFRIELFSRFLFSALVDADYLDTEAHFDPDKAQHRGTYPTIATLWQSFLQERQDFMNQVDPTTAQSSVNRVRAEVYQACVDAAERDPGVYRLAVPTGGGKTRSGLAFGLRHALVHQMDRVIVAVPYTSIIEQTAEVYRQILGAEAVLEHHSAVRDPVALSQEQQDQLDEGATRFQAQARLATQNWDAPLIVTTTVQLFESLFANRPGACRKLHNIVNSVIILDEVQTLPLGLLDPILNVLKELVQNYHVTVVLCTATQPALEGSSYYLRGLDHVQDMISPDQAKAHFRQLNRVRFEMPPQPWSWSDLATDLSEQHQALVVLNTRKDALAVLDALGSQEGLFHLSTLLCGQHRRQVLAEVRQRLKAGDPCYLVSTQVVEAGVDLDFPVVYRALGPLDRIVQAAGRCNREGLQSDLGRVVIFEPVEGGMPRGDYGSAVAATQQLLKHIKLNLSDPDLFQDYFQRLYQTVELDKQGIQALRQRQNYPEVAKRFRLIPEGSQPVVVNYDPACEQIMRQIRRRGLFSGDHRALQPYLVNLRPYEFRLSEGSRVEIAPNLWLWEGGYDPLKGIQLGSKSIDYDPIDLIL